MQCDDDMQVMHKASTLESKQINHMLKVCKVCYHLHAVVPSCIVRYSIVATTQRVVQMMLKAPNFKSQQIEFVLNKHRIPVQILCLHSGMSCR